MPATIRLSDQEATIDGLEWRSDSPSFRELVQTTQDTQVDLMYGASPDPDITAARRVASALGAIVIDESPTPYNFVEGRIY